MSKNSSRTTHEFNHTESTEKREVLDIKPQNPGISSSAMFTKKNKFDLCYYRISLLNCGESKAHTPF
jgi:hypothetical protein